MRILPALALLVLLAGCLDPSTGKDGVADVPGKASLVHYRPVVDLGSKAGVAGGPVPAGAFGTNCQDSLDDGDCGLGEPVLEVAGDGSVYASGTCCLTVAPPVYVSRDGGTTFQELATPTRVRESFGIEGDFAIDDVGRVYFADIEFAATFQMTVWEKDGTFVRHTKWPAPPLVDRDWVRAEGDGIVYYAYNTGTATNLYKSTDAARTFTPTALFQAPFGLGNLLLGREPGTVILLGGSSDGNTLAEISTDGGATFREEVTTIPSGGNFPVGAFDEAGRLYGAGSLDDAITVSVRDADGRWGPALNVSPAGHHRMPWIGAGADGAAAVAWYGTNATDIDPDAQWFLYVAVTVDGGKTWDVQRPDPVPVIQSGDLGRQLLDFLQCEVGPDGSVHVAYSSMPFGEEPEERLHYVRSDPIPGMAPTVYPNGPHA